MSFGFISSNKELLHRFIECSANSFEFSSRVDQKYDMLISYYNVESYIEDYINILLYQEDSDDSGNRVWEACGCKLENPYVIYKKFDQNICDIEPWFNGKYSVLNSFTLLDDAMDPSAEGTDFSIYKIYDKQTFMAISKCFLLDPPIIAAVPGTTKLEKIPNLISKLCDLNTYSDLCCINDILDTCDWFYTLNRGHIDDSYSLFASSNQTTMRNYLNLDNKSDQFKLVSCF